MTRPEPARAPGPRMRRPHHAVDSDHRSDERSWSVLAEESDETEHQLLLHDRNPQQPVPMAQHFRAEQFIADLSAPAKTQHLEAEVTARHPQRLAVKPSEPCAVHLATAAAVARGQPITQRQHRVGRAGTDGIKTQHYDLEWSMNERLVSHAYGADDPGLPSPPTVTDVRHMLREQRRNDLANAEPPSRPPPFRPSSGLGSCGCSPCALSTPPSSCWAWPRTLFWKICTCRYDLLYSSRRQQQRWSGRSIPRLQRRFGAWLTR